MLIADGLYDFSATREHRSCNSMNKRMTVLFFSFSWLTVNFSVLMSRIQSIWSWLVSTRVRLGEGLCLSQGVGGWGFCSSGNFHPIVVALGQLPALCRSVTVPKHKYLLPLEELPVSSYSRTKISTSF